MPANDPWQAALGLVFDELVAGPPAEFPFVLDPDSGGLMGRLRSLDAAAANARPAAGRRSVAEHAAHLAYSLNVFERWAGGEENPYATADWDGSWRAEVATDADWAALLDRLERTATACSAALRGPNRWDEISRAGAVGTVAHTAYHLGAIRQLAAGGA